MDQNQNSVSFSATGNSPLPKTGELLSSSWNIFKRHWKTLVGISVIPALINFIASIFTSTGVGAIIGIPLYIVSGILMIPMLVALISTINDLVKDSTAHTNIKTKYKNAFAIFWSCVLLIIILALAVGGATLLFVIPGIIIGLYARLAIYELVLEGKKGLSAITSSFEIVRGRWWSYLGRMLIVLIIIAIFAALVGLVVSFIIIGQFAAQTVVNLIITSVALPFIFVYEYLLYTALKRTKLETQKKHSFKGWIIGFMTVGIVGIVIGIILAITVPAFLLWTFRSDFKDRAKLEQLMRDLPVKVENSEQISLPQ